MDICEMTAYRTLPTLITLIIHSEFNKLLGRNDHAQMKQSPLRAEYCATGREERK